MPSKFSSLQNVLDELDNFKITKNGIYIYDYTNMFDYLMITMFNNAPSVFISKEYNEMVSLRSSTHGVLSS